MSLIAGLTLATTLLAGPAPDMSVQAQGLNLARRDEALILAQRIRVASRDWCALNRAFLTPDSIGDPRVCEQEMRRRAVNAIPRTHRVDFVRAGGRTALNRP